MLLENTYGIRNFFAVEINIKIFTVMQFVFFLFVLLSNV